MNLFKREPEVKILEVERNTRLPELTPDLKESLKTLPFHPAFAFLMQKLRVQRAVVEHNLHEGYLLDERQLRYLQAGVFWLNWIEKEVKAATSTPTTETRSALEREAEEFARMKANLDLVGVE